MAVMASSLCEIEIIIRNNYSAKMACHEGKEQTHFLNIKKVLFTDFAHAGLHSNSDSTSLAVDRELDYIQEDKVFCEASLTWQFLITTPSLEGEIILKYSGIFVLWYLL